MDVHRSRFIPYPTSAITALAFSRSNDSGYQGPPPTLRLAVGRANGNIEIWNPLKGAWVQETVLVGEEKSIDALVWTQDPDEADAEGKVIPGQQRLFSIASSPAVTEWDLATGQPKRRSTGNFSEVWCLAAQPRARSSQDTQIEVQAQDLLAGCGDGAIVSLSTSDGDLQFKRFLARPTGGKAGCLSLTYQTRHVAIVGFDDGNLRVYDTRNGSQLRQMSLGAGIPGAPKKSLVWQVKCLPNGDIASGDSNGEVKIWDGKNYSLMQRLTGHDTECIDLVVSRDGNTIISGSLDGRMAVYRQTSSAGGRRSFAKSIHRKVHRGEVKAMAVFDSKSGLSVVVSGGEDVSPILTPLRNHGKENLRSLPAIPQDPAVTSASKARLLVSWWDRIIYVWRIARQASGQEPSKARKLVLRASLDTKDSLRHVCISSDGKLLAAATSSEVKLFQLRRRANSDSLAVRKIEAPNDFTTLGARLLSISPNGKWLAAVTPDSEVHVARFTDDEAQPKRTVCIQRTVELDRHSRSLAPSAYKEYDRTISRLAFATDSSVLAACDLSGLVDSWVLEGHEDVTAPAVDVTKHDSKKGSSNGESDAESDSSDDDEDDEIVLYYGQHWSDNPAVLPKLDSAALIFTFRPTSTQRLVNGNPGVHPTRHNPHAHSHELPHGEHRLFVLTATHHMYEFDVLAGRLSDWSRRNPTAVLREQFTRIRDRTMGAVWDVNGEKQRLWLHGTSWVFMLNLSGDMGESAQLGSKRSQSSGVATTNKKRRVEAGPARRLEDGRWSNVDLDGTPRRGADEDDEEDDGDLDLHLTRTYSGGENREVARPSEPKEERKWWSTFKYRPILAMVPLEDEFAPEGERMLEVAIVERPLGDLRGVTSE